MLLRSFRFRSFWLAVDEGVLAFFSFCFFTAVTKSGFSLIIIGITPLSSSSYFWTKGTMAAVPSFGSFLSVVIISKANELANGGYLLQSSVKLGSFELFSNDSDALASVCHARSFDDLFIKLWCTTVGQKMVRKPVSQGFGKVCHASGAFVQTVLHKSFWKLFLRLL